MLKAGQRAGLWTLAERIGRGGMAEVWRGVADDAADVAIKLMPQASSDRGFESEAAALARLVHPRIIRIVDFGVMESETHGLPFLALELARGPSLDRWLSHNPIHWHHVLDIARRVLEALAHAHSRGIVHRDIKPANILAMDAAGVDWRLTDFGIARTDSEVADEHNPSGTPPYMAPEQFTGRSRDQGPWTDIYSLACVLYEMLTGCPPFVGDGFIQLAFRHMKEPAPPLAPRVEVPEGLDELLAVMLRKDPLSRFRSAADVLRAFETLPKVRASKAVAAVSPHGSADTYVTPPFEPTVLLGDLVDFEWRPEDEGEAPLVEAGAPPADPPATSPRHYFATFHGDTGPGLIGLRELPFVGRLVERTVIWNEFRDVVATKTLGTMVVQGPAGIGKTAIGRWLTQTVNEYGLAISVCVDGDTDVRSALLSALAKTYRLDGRLPHETAERLRRWASPPEWAIDALVRALGDHAVPDEDVVGAAIAMLWAQAERRPVLLWVDDVDDAARWAFVTRISTLHYRDVPVFVVAATRATVPPITGVDVVSVEPFAAGECAELITELIGIGADEAFGIAKAVDGNPQFAVEVIREWQANGLLVRRSGRWTLRAGQVPKMPDSVGAVRAQQFEALVGDQLPDRRALELLACYGGTCPHGDWVRACAGAAIRPGLGLIVRAMRAGLLEQRDEVLRYTDSVLRRRIVAAATEAGRRAEYHRAIAEIVSERPDAYPPSLIGTHLFEAGNLEASLEPLLRAAQSYERGEQVEQQELLQRYETVVAALGLTDAEQGWWGRYIRAKLLIHQWKIAEARAALGEVLVAARENGWVELECDCTISYANLVSARAPVLRDGEIAARGIRLADSLGDPLRRARTRTAAGAMYGYLGRTEDARKAYVEARAIAAEAENVSECAEADYGIGWVYFLQGKLDLALGPLQRAIDEMESVGQVRGAYAVRSFTGDVLRALGRLDEAEAVFTEAYHYFSRYHMLEAVMPANFALLEVARGRVNDALRWARRAREIEATRGRAPILSIVDAIELLHAAQEADLAAWDLAFAALRRSTTGDDASYDVAYLTDIAARETLGTLDSDRAAAVVALAIDFWSRLGRQAEVDALRATL